MFINTELLEFIRLKNPLSSVVEKYEVIEKDCCKCPFCHSKTNSLRACLVSLHQGSKRSIIKREGGEKR